MRSIRDRERCRTFGLSWVRKCKAPAYLCLVVKAIGLCWRDGTTISLGYAFGSIICLSHAIARAAGAESVASGRRTALNS